jgi:glycosyltransferase involved in cell wall biosynthesis
MSSVSVIVPSLNVAPYIQHCLDSIKNQTFTYFRAWGQRA